MTESWIVYICLMIGLSSALVAGVFQAFSDFVMKGLARSEPGGGMESMQHINVTVMRSVFLSTFFLLIPATLGTAAYVWGNAHGLGETLIIAGAGVYLVTVVLVTLAGNVPMNNRLAGLSHVSGDAHAYWARYGRDWTRWNHVRTLGSVATAALFLLAAVSIH